MKNRLINMMIAFIGCGMLLSSCYKEEHFSMPSVGGDYVEDSDSMPNPFDGANRLYLVKDGVADYTKMSLMGFTDFAVEMPTSESSWEEKIDSEGKQYLACRQHRNFYPLGGDDHFGGEQLSYMYNALTSRIFLQNGDGKNWKLSGRMAVDALGQDVHSMISFEGSLGWSGRSVFSFDWVYKAWSASYLTMIRNGVRTSFFNGRTEMGTFEYLSPSQAFDLEIYCVDNFYYLKINGETVWAQSINDAVDHTFPLVIRPWMSGMRFYDLSIEGDYYYNKPVGSQNENGYASVQAPALAKIGDEVLLFAEGRHESIIQSSKLSSVRSNATDIIVKRSSDGGVNWSSWTVLKGDGQGVFIRPEVINAGDKTYLFYTVDLTGKQDGNYKIEYLVSTDAGQTWEAGNEINVAIDGYALSTLSGHGIKTTDGRLALPIQCRVGNRGTIALLYSEDGGANWILGTPIDGLRNQNANIVELDGKLVMYLGHSSAGDSRKIVTSTDGGASWSMPIDANIPTGESGQYGYGSTVQMGSKMWHFTPTKIEKTNKYNASSVNAYPWIGAKEQKMFYIYKPAIEQIGSGLTVTVSEDGGVSWTESKDISGMTAYKEYLFPTGAMDAVVVGDEVLVVVESGTTVPYEGLLTLRTR